MSMINDGGGFDGYRVFKNGSAFQPSQREGISVSTDGLQGSGLQLCALQTRRRSDERPPPQSARRSVHHFEGNRLDYFRREAHFHARRDYRARCAEGLSRSRQRLEQRCDLYDSRRHSAEKISLGGRTLLWDGIPNCKKVPRWKKQ